MALRPGLLWRQVSEDTAAEEAQAREMEEEAQVGIGWHRMA